MGKYFTKRVSPTIPVANMIDSDKSDNAFGARDVLFNWFAFDIPKGSAMLKNVTLLVAGNHGARQAEVNIQLLFAKKYNGTAPGDLGTPNATADGVGYTKNILGVMEFDNTDGTQSSTDYFSIMQSGYEVAGDTKFGAGNFVIEGEEANKDGTQTIYVAGISLGAGLNFSTNCLADGAVTSGAATDITVASNAQNNFDVGDVVLVHDSDTAIGTVASVPDATSIILESANGVAIADEDEIMPQSPVKIILHLEA